MRVGRNDFKAVREWVAGNAADVHAEKALKEMASMPRGTGHLWAPSWADAPELKYCKVSVGRRRTFHPSRWDLLQNRQVRILQLLAGKKDLSATLGEMWQRLLRALRTQRAPHRVNA